MKKAKIGGKTRISNLAQTMKDRRTVNSRPLHPSDTTATKKVRDAQARLSKGGGLGGMFGIKNR